MAGKKIMQKYIIPAIIIVAIIIALFMLRQPPVDRDPEIMAYFSPRGQIADLIIKEINQAKKSIDIAMYAFTKRDIAWAIVKAKKRGVRVRIILDKKSSKSRYSKFKFFQNKEIIPRPIKRTMHNKFALIDGNLLITGSYNWTANAENNNHENILFIRNSPEVIKAYSDRFERLWRIGENRE